MAPNDAEAVLEGLEHRLRSHESPYVRMRAGGMLAGLVHAKYKPEGPDRMPWLLRLYDEVDDPDSRAGLLRRLIFSEDVRALPLMARVAVQTEEEEDYLGAAHDALYGLVRMGEEGRAVLRRLHEEGAVQTADARFVLRRLAENDFQLPLAPRP